jgi:hypothetical protein
MDGAGLHTGDILAIPKDVTKNPRILIHDRSPLQVKRSMQKLRLEDLSFEAFRLVFSHPLPVSLHELRKVLVVQKSDRLCTSGLYESSSAPTTRMNNGCLGEEGDGFPQIVFRYVSFPGENADGRDGPERPGNQVHHCTDSIFFPHRDKH